MANHPALGLLMYGFLENFKKNLLENLGGLEHLVTNQRLEDLKENTIKFIDEELGNRVKDKIKFRYSDIKTRLKTIVESLENKAITSGNDIQKKFQYLTWPYFFVRIQDEERDQMAMWFPDYKTCESIQKPLLYPTHYLEPINNSYLPNKDNKKLWGYIEEGGENEGAIQDLTLGNERDLAGIKSFQNKIYKNMFKRKDIESINIDLFSGNFSLFQQIVETNYKENNINKNVQGLIALCSPLIGFFNPKGREGYDVLIGSEKNLSDKTVGRYNIGYIDIKKEDIYQSTEKAFAQANGLDYFRSFHKELEQIKKRIKERAEHKANKIFKDNVSSHSHTLFTRIPAELFEDIKRAFNNNEYHKAREYFYDANKLFDIFLVSLYSVLDRSLPPELKKPNVNELLKWLKKRRITNEKEPELCLESQESPIISVRYADHFLIVWNLWHNASRQYPGATENNFKVKAFFEGKIFAISFTNKGKMSPQFIQYLNEKGSIPPEKVGGLKIVKSKISDLGFYIHAKVLKGYTTVTVIIPEIKSN